MAGVLVLESRHADKPLYPDFDLVALALQRLAALASD